ncbi:hypothetical protein CN681_31770 [Bacillus toyonensis]|jgi:hypothetical protein|uniref:Group-specific protein n=2 Tax=Bacillus toyonensis TaxID=155322 RepID=A0AB73S7A5_9BACI|nr:hypothetical protein CN678_18755 [Bacillus toyonensis]PEK02514.1 hypothetical protein CN681_31770 [Bacillus toyonensis]PEL53051.1 hypothetical protein CN638_09715 [Bacillus toyonensis]PEM47983.1 hypothetical protein CN636_04025 [Bacillus toyonensis]PEP84190.1 hypothetical protein CN581_00035 [Bacillus toyonensis]
MMNKRKWLYRIGILLVSIGCILANLYSDIPPLFPSLHKGIGMSVVVVGLFCLITSNFYRKSESI